MVERHWLVFVRIHTVDLMVEHQAKLKDAPTFLITVNSVVDLLEYSYLLWLRHVLEQLIEALSWEYLPVSVAEEHKFVKNELDSLFLILKGEVQLLLQVDVLVTGAEGHQFFDIAVLVSLVRL